MRVLAGGEAAQVPVSHWLLVFSMFFFLSLAFVKRYAELIAIRGSDGDALAGRGYRLEDLSLVPMMGLSSGFVAILVIGLWASSPDVGGLYREPALLSQFLAHLRTDEVYAPYVDFGLARIL